MSKCQKIKDLIMQEFQYGEDYTIEEITKLAMERKIITSNKDAAVRNALFQLKRDGCIANTNRGMFHIINSDESTLMLEKAIRHVLAEVNNLKSFNWVNCSDEELMIMRKKFFIISNLEHSIKRVEKEGSISEDALVEHFRKKREALADA